MARDPADRPEPPSRGALPVVDRVPGERADAARNRKRILAAAQRLLVSSGIESLSMEAVAAAAGVGVGTVYRRFGDRSGLAFALIDEREGDLQAAFLTGPPPLGPGAPARERIRAFLHALVDRLEEQQDLILLAETATPYGRFSGAYAAQHTHLAILLEEAGLDDHAHYLADALMAPTAANLYLRQRREYGMSTEQIKDGIDALLSLDLHQPIPPGRPVREGE